MAQVILSNVGQAVGGPVGRVIGSMVGAQIDRAAIDSLSPARQIGPRLEGLKVQGTSEGAPIPAVFGRMRVVGQVIWAARFLEHRRKGRAGKGGPRTVDYGYSLSFAVGLCEGPIDGVGRVWADGEPMDLSGVAMRVHRGTADQAPDPVIEAVEGAAPAYRDLAYVVFEDLSLEAFGDRVPQFAFEVFRRPRSETPRMEDRIEGVCLTPGSGEFVLATTPVLRREGLFRTVAENVNNREGRADFEVSLDQLTAQLPNLKRVTLVVSWFGDDLRCGRCRVRPGVERRDKVTLGQDWSAAGIGREAAHLISEADGGPAYGGTPSDASVEQAIAALKARGLEVTVAPFLMMDVPAGNGLPDPYGGAEQAAHPWRGRVTADPGDADVDGQVAAFFEGWRAMVLHYAGLAAGAGADGLLVGSEFRGLTTLRGADGYPAVEDLRVLAGECRAAMGPQAMITYAADWTEWSGVQPPDDPDGFMFHLDPLWSDPAISCVGVDWYPPVSDWRDGAHLDRAEGWGGADDRAYLTDRVQGGEGYDWFYADAAARLAQERTPISDGAHGEPWVFRPKDLAGWWSHAHHDRIGGVRAAEATGWTPGMKPVRLIEFGCGAVDRGGNAPNRFHDPKSAESGAPPFSNGRRDDAVQRALIEATMDAFENPAANPVIGGQRMLEAMDVWCWDARPFPDFPARAEVWSDGGNWTTGHWLNGRLTGEAADLIVEIAARCGVAAARLDLSGVGGTVDGYGVDRPMTGLEALSPFLTVLGLEPVERDGRVGFVGEAAPAVALGEDDLALPDDAASPVGETRSLAEPAAIARLRFIDGQADYAIGAVTVRAGEEAETRVLDLPVVTEAGRAEGVGRRVLAAEEGAAVEARAHLSPLTALRLEPGDAVTLPGSARVWRVARVDLDETPTASLTPVVAVDDVGAEGVWRPGEPVTTAGPPWLAVLDLPAFGADTDDDAPWLAVAADPWRAMDVHAGAEADQLSVRARVTTPATAGVLVEPLAAGEAGRWREEAITVWLPQGDLETLDRAAVLDGGNLLAVASAAGGWELVQFRTATPVGPEVWRLEGLLRGQAGTEVEAGAGASAGAAVVVLDDALVRAEMAAVEAGRSLVWRAASAGTPPGGLASTEVVSTWARRARRPWAPGHLKARVAAGEVTLDWVRRSRALGDGWDSEPPLLEEREVWQVEVVNGGVAVAQHETAAPGFVWSAGQRVIDLTGAAADGLRLMVRQGSAIAGWGAVAEIAV